MHHRPASIVILIFCSRAIQSERICAERRLQMRCLRPLAVLSIALMSLADCAMASGTPLVGAHAVQIWSAASGKRELSLDENAAIFDVAFSLDGSKLATAGQTGISLWDLASGRKVWQEDDGAVLVVFAPDGKWIARSEEHTSELQSLRHLVCRLLLE